MDEDFINRANIKRNENLLKTEKLFTANSNDWLTAFAKHFQSVCAGIVKMQNDSSLPAISYMEYTMLYTNFIKRRYLAEIWIYDDKSYLDKNQCFIGSYDISFLFIYFDELWDKLISMRKRYVGKVTAREVKAYMIQALPDFYSYLINIARFAIIECIEGSPFADIKKTGQFMVNVGDYMAKTETVYHEQRNKDARQLTEWFNEQLLDKYIFGDYSALDFSQQVFFYTDFRYAQFSNSTLKKTVFDGSKLIGANFRKANMEGCSLAGCSIFEADFSHATLKNANFTNVRGKAGLADDKNWRFAGFLPVRFRNSNLTGADFSGADLSGADFSGANLTCVDFSNAVLDGVNFSGAVLDDAIFN